MFTLSVAVGNTTWRLLYKEESTALAAYRQLSTPDYLAGEVADDFGQKLNAKPQAIHGLLLEDMNKIKMAHVELALHGARTQAMANKAALSDPQLKASSLVNGGGPAMLNPMGMRN